MSAGGSIQEVTIKGRRFAVAADGEVSRKLGGFEKTLEANGDGSSREILTRVMGKLDGIVLSIDDNAGDAEFLQEVADTIGQVACTITYVTGKVYTGAGSITGEIVTASNNTTCTVVLEFNGKLATQ